jgi:hypothetical protein
MRTATTSRDKPPLIARAAEALGDPRSMPDCQWASALLGVSRTRVEEAMDELGRFESLERAIREKHRAGGRDFYAQLRAPFELYALARLAKPDHVVETGVSSGVSSAHVLLALRENGRGLLHSIDLPVSQRGPQLSEKESPVSLPPGRESGWAVPEELVSGWDLWVGPSEALLPQLVAELDRVDLFLHDSLHTPEHLAFELDTIRPKLKPGSIVLADNTEWTGRAFDRFAESIGAVVHRRGGSDLVGLRVPEGFVAPPSAPAEKRPRADAGRRGTGRRAAAGRSHRGRRSR